MVLNMLILDKSGLFLTAMDPYVRHEKEQIIYDQTNFIGDVGGLLGLLLGVPPDYCRR